MTDVFVQYGRTDLLELGGRLNAVLSAEERARRDRFVFEDDRRDFAAAHGLLRHQLSALGGLAPEDWRFAANAGGKPAIINPDCRLPLAFSLSHTKGMVACAVTVGVAVGVDIERIDRAPGSYAAPASCFSEDERRLLRQAPPEDYATRAIEFWTLKEAFVKGTGAGLAAPLDAISFSYHGDCHLQLRGVDDADEWRFLLARPSEGARLALAIRAGDIGDSWRTLVHEVPGPAGRPQPQFLRWSADWPDAQCYFRSPT